MDILCFHSNEEIRGLISDFLSDMDFEYECHLTSDIHTIREKITSKMPTVSLIEMKKENLSLINEKLKTFVIPMLKSIDRDIAINLETAGVDYILTDSISGFRENLMKVLLKHEEELGEFIHEERIFKNVVYGFGFSWGRTYVATMEQSAEILKIVEKLGEGIDVFLATREKPRNYKSERIKVVWVTDLVGKNRIKPHNLTILTDSIIKFLEEKHKRVVVLDCVEYLLLYNDFVNVLRNIELINSYAMEYDSLVIIIIDNNAYTTKEYSLLKRYAMVWKGA